LNTTSADSAPFVAAYCYDTRRVEVVEVGGIVNDVLLLVTFHYKASIGTYRSVKRCF
jgi:hypothetical protein